MTDKEKVLKRNSNASAWQATDFEWWITDCGNGSIDLGHGRTQEAAWQNAAASLPAQPEQEEGVAVTHCEEHGFRDCSVCFHDEPLLPSPANDGFQEWLCANSEGMEGEDDAETLMHVAWRAALLKSKEKTC